MLLVPLALALGFDRMTALAIIFLGAGSGVLASTVNPFATGVASDAAGIGVGDGIGLRVVMWFVIVGAAIAYVLRYAYRVRADPARSVLGLEGMSPAGLEPADAVAGDVAPLTGRQKFVLVLFFAAFAVMIYGFVPWGEISESIFGADFPLPTFTALLLRPGDRAVHRHGGRDRARRPSSARRARSTRSSPAPRTSSAPR